MISWLLFPAKLIVDTALRLQICRFLSVICLTEGRHTEGLICAGVQAVCIVQLVEILSGCTKIAVVFHSVALCCVRRPGFTGTKDEWILFIKFLLPLSEESPYISWVILYFLWLRCRRQWMKNLMHPVNSGDKCCLIADIPCFLRINAVGYILFPGIVRRICLLAVLGIEISRIRCLQGHCVKIHAGVPSGILIAYLCHITVGTQLSVTIKVSSSCLTFGICRIIIVVGIWLIVSVYEPPMLVRWNIYTDVFISDIFYVRTVRYASRAAWRKCYSLLLIPFIEVVGNRIFVVPYVQMVFLLPVITKAHRYLIGSRSLCYYIDNACQSAASVENRTSALYYFDSLNGISRNIRKVIFTTPWNRISVHKNERPGLVSAQRCFVGHGAEGCTDWSMSLCNKTIGIVKCFRRVFCSLCFYILRSYDIRRSRDIHIPFFTARCRNNCLINGVFVQTLSCFSFRCIRACAYSQSRPQNSCPHKFFLHSLNFPPVVFWITQ